jgi:CHAT domain-containing protein/tetratricopeptide (TPR) repeat protein
LGADLGTPMRIVRALVGALLIIPQGSSIRSNGRPTQPVLAGSFEGKGGGAPELLPLLRSAKEAFRKQEISKSIEIYERALRLAEQSGGARDRGLAHWGLGAGWFVARDYGRAWTHLLAAREYLRQGREWELAAGVEVNLSSLYFHLGEAEAALELGERAVALLPGRTRHRLAAPALFNLAAIQAGTGRLDEAIRTFSDGIQAAEFAADRESEATGWSKLGFELLQAGRLAEAEAALVESFRLRRLFRLSQLDVSRETLSQIKLEQGDLQAAERILGPAPASPSWRYFYTRGRLREARGRLEAAVRDLRRAVALLQFHRERLPQSDALRLSADWVWQRVPKAYADTAARLALRTGSSRLAEEAQEILEYHRSASLHHRLRVRPFRLARSGVPDLAAAGLGKAEAALLRADRENQPRFLRQMHAAWVEADAAQGEAAPQPVPRTGQALRASLDSDEALLSFALGPERSLAWMATRGGVWVRELPSRELLASRIAAFRHDLENDRLRSPAGEELCRALLAQIPAPVKARPVWLLSLERDLFALPFAALPCGKSGRPLVHDHTLHVVPGAWMMRLREATPVQPGWFLGLGDPVYNPADPRRQGWQRRLPSEDWLSRLPGSAEEIRASASRWPGPARLLVGPQATRQRLREALEDGPAVVHLATHVVQAPAPGPAHNFLAFSLTPAGAPEMVGQLEISAGWRTDARLVVLSGCASGQGPARDGAGLEGMTRAWLAAGAHAVLATLWPVRDESASFFPGFYEALRTDPARNPARALRRAQLRALEAGSCPSLWASYFLISTR